MELALILPVMLFLIVGALDLGRVFYSKIAVTDAAKEGVLAASQGKTGAQITMAAVTEAKGGLVEIQAANVSYVTCPAHPDGATPPVAVTVQAPFHAMTPFISGILGGNDIMIGATATARCRYTPPFPGTPAPTPTPTPTPPATCSVPNFKNSSTSTAQATWTAAGFSSTVSFSGTPPYTIKTQSLTKNTSLPCATTSITVGP